MERPSTEAALVTYVGRTSTSVRRGVAVAPVTATGQKHSGSLGGRFFDGGPALSPLLPRPKNRRKVKAGAGFALFEGVSSMPLFRVIVAG